MFAVGQSPGALSSMISRISDLVSYSGKSITQGDASIDQGLSIDRIQRMTT